MIIDNPIAETIRTNAPIDLADYRGIEAAGGIVYFDGTDHDFLSNFHRAPIAFLEEDWPTSEHAYQAMKFYELERQQAIRQAKGPGEAKRLGRALPGMRADWDQVKYAFMLEIVRAKFAQHPELAEQLLATGDAHLVEGNHWHDNIWGFCLCQQHRGGLGLNALGNTLMTVREELR